MSKVNELPSGWSQVQFEEAVDIISDRGFRIKQKNYLSSGRTPVVDQGEGLIGGYTDDTEARIETPLPVIVFGDHTRRFKFVSFPFAVGADGVKLFHPVAICDPKFLFLQLGTVDLENRGYGRHYQHLRKELLLLPPFHEQTRIVAKVEELLSDLDAGVAELKAAHKKLGQYRQALLKAAVDGSLTGVSGGYPKKLLSELVTSIGQGWSPRCKIEAVEDDEVWAVIKTTAIQPLRFDSAYNKELPSTLIPRKHLELRTGDLLVTRAGPRVRVGVTCLVRKTKKRLILCDKAYRIRCNESLIDPEFLELVLNAPHIVNEIDTLKTGINDSGLNLTQDRFSTLMIPVPSLAEQTRVVESIAAAVLSIEQQTRAIEISLKQSAAQRQNILKAAFSGQLVPQDPNDEPARQLLERIRSERAARGGTGKSRKRQVHHA